MKEICLAVKHLHDMNIAHRLNIPMTLHTGRQLSCKKSKESNTKTKLVHFCHCLETPTTHKMVPTARDLKPENLLYASSEPGAQIKLGDFGFAKQTVENRSKAIC